MQTRFELPAELTIYQVAELREVWLRQLDGAVIAPALNCGAAAVAEVDGAGLQLLLALHRWLLQHDSRLVLDGASAVLRTAAASLGLHVLLRDATEEAAA